MIIIKSSNNPIVDVLRPAQKLQVWNTYIPVNLDLWNLFIAIVSLGLTYQVRIMTKASTVLKKSTFPKFSHLNALGSKFDLEVN